MTRDLSTVSIRAGHLPGAAFWDPDRQTYGLELSVFEPGPAYPPSRVRYGRRHGEFTTVDALANHCVANGLGLDGRSLDELHGLASAVDERWGHGEIVGLVTVEGRGRLYLRNPDRSVIELSPATDHPDDAFCWGRPGAPAECAADAVVRRSFGLAPPDDLLTFALTVRVEYLDSVSGDFSLNTKSLCDWCLADASLVTRIDETERRLLRRVLLADDGARSRPLPA